MYDFVSFPLFGLILIIKLKNVAFGSHWKTLIFFDKNNMVSDLNITHQKMSDFVSLSLSGFTLVIALKNFDFEGQYFLIKYLFLRYTGGTG